MTRNTTRTASWMNTIRTISRERAENIDDILMDVSPRVTKNHAGSPVWPEEIQLLGLSPALRGAEDGVVGVRVTEETLAFLRPEVHAATLAALGLEHDTDIVILSHVPYSGYERFGFRVERIVGETPEERAACEDQIIAFWNIQVFA